MNIKTSSRIIIISSLIFVILLGSIGLVYGASSKELKNQQANIDKQIEETNSEIAGVKSQMTKQLDQINELNAEISGFQTEIDNLQYQINTLTTQINEKQVNIDEQQAKFDTQKEALEKRLIAMYESGSVSYLDMLLSSDGLADFISKYYLIEQLAEYDEELLKNIEDTRNQIQAEKTELENSKNQIETSKNQIQTKQNSLAVSRNQKNAIVSNLSAEEKELQEKLEEFEEDKRAIQSQLAALSRNSSVKDVVAPSAAGYISPLAGKTKANITTGYYGYKNHTGVDFRSPGGTPIRAVKSGTVVISTALRRANGTYKSYGEYVVIDHHDGTMTLYAHMTPNSRTVSANQSVSQGQTIGLVGTTGNSTGNHLHFEVRIGGSPVNPTPYLP